MSTTQLLPQRKPIRKPGYNYSEAGYYHVIQCTYDREWLFGEVVGVNMRLNIVGQTTQAIWTHLPQRFPGVELDEYMFMPNHFHGIVILPPPDHPNYKQVTLHKVMHDYKALVTRWVHVAGIPFGWQRRYRDRIIRDEEHFAETQQYIRDNPLKWALKEEEDYTPLKHAPNMPVGDPTREPRRDRLCG